jgi:DDE superfamily endonuclease
MFWVPRALTPLRDGWMSDFSRAATARRVVFLMLAAILVTGNRTVANLLRLIGFIEQFNPSTYHRVLSHRRWNATRLARIMIGFLLDRYAPRGMVRLCGDETIDGHRGKKVYGKARHRDAVRSSHSHTVFRYGHKWIVLAILIELPCCNRPFALPILIALYRDKATNAREGRRHKTPVELMCGLLALLIRWFPERTWRFAGDGGYGTHEFARFAHRHRKRLTLVSKFFADANLHKLPPKRKAGTNGRPRTKGAPLPKPAAVVRRSKAKRLKVRWYGGGTRQVEVVTGSGNWFKSGHGLVPVAWVYVRDLSGTHRDEYFFTTDVSLSAKTIIEMYGARWNIETTFQEMRSHLGLETTRGWSRQTVLRMAPCLFVLYTIVVMIYDALPASRNATPLIQWTGKHHVAFADMIAHVRRYLWQEWVFRHVPGGHHLRKLPPATQRLLQYGLCQAA